MGATFGTGNMGVSALTAGSIEIALNTWPNARILLLDYGKTPMSYQYNSRKGMVTVELLNMRFSKRLYLRNNIAILVMYAAMLRLVPDRLRRSITARSRYLGEINRADVVVSMSGGDSFSDIYGVARFFYSYLPLLLVQLAGKRLVFFPQTLGPFNGWVSRALARYIVRRAALVYSRDRDGVDEVRGWLGARCEKDRIRFCYDVGFLVNPVQPGRMDLTGCEEREGHSPTIGFNVSGLLWMGGYTQNNQFGLKGDYRRLVEALIGHLTRKKGVKVLLIPHVFGRAEGSESDQTVCEELYYRLRGQYAGKLYLARGTYDQSEIKYVIGLCDFFIGSRMHACVAALSQEIPTVAVAYSKKFVGVMGAIGLEPYVADARVMNEDEILNTVDKAWAERSEIRRHLQRKMAEVKTCILNLGKEVAVTLGGRG